MTSRPSSPSKTEIYKLREELKEANERIHELETMIKSYVDECIERGVKKWK